MSRIKLISITTSLALCWGCLFAQDAVLLGDPQDAPFVAGMGHFSLFETNREAPTLPEKPADLFVLQAKLSAQETPEAAADALRQRAQAVARAFPSARIAVVSPFPFSTPSGIFPKNRALHKLLEREVPTWPRAVYVDIFTKIPFKNRTEAETFFTEDGALPGERGVDIWQSLVGPHLETPIAPPAGAVENRIVFSDPASFAAWPAGSGSWVWGDEMLVCFTQAPFIEKSGHNLNLKGPQWLMCARSLDGGKTWSTEPHPELDGCSTEASAKASPRKRDIAPAPLEAPIDFTHPDLALLMRNGELFVSNDRGRSWLPPVPLPRFERPLRQWARTAYIPLDKSHCLFFMSEFAYENPGKKVERGWCYAMETKDGGKTFDFLGTIGEYPKDILRQTPFELSQPSFGIMPSVVRLDDGTLVAARRSRVGERRWTDIYQSVDGGKTWIQRAVAEAGGDTPPALVKLPGENTLALVYCNRFQPYGLRGRISQDGGKTWSQPYVLRDDGLEWDLGYNRAHAVGDGKIITFYYYTTKERPQQHIAATVWDVSKTLREKAQKPQNPKP